MNRNRLLTAIRRLFLKFNYQKHSCLVASQLLGIDGKDYADYTFASAVALGLIRIEGENCDTYFREYDHDSGCKIKITIEVISG